MSYSKSGMLKITMEEEARLKADASFSDKWVKMEVSRIIAFPEVPQGGTCTYKHLVGGAELIGEVG